MGQKKQDVINKKFCNEKTKKEEKKQICKGTFDSKDQESVVGRISEVRVERKKGKKKRDDKWASSSAEL